MTRAPSHFSAAVLEGAVKTCFMLGETRDSFCRLTPDEPLVFDFIRSAVNSVDRLPDVQISVIVRLSALNYRG